MAIVCMLQDATTWVSGGTHWIDTLQVLHWHPPFDLLKLGDEIIRVDLFGDVQRAFNTFVKTGQIWAFLIGIILGYLFKSFTSYG
jgi:hypothetical protein